MCLFVCLEKRCKQMNGQFEPKTILSVTSVWQTAEAVGGTKRDCPYTKFPIELGLNPSTSLSSGIRLHYQGMPNAVYSTAKRPIGGAITEYLSLFDIPA